MSLPTRDKAPPLTADHPATAQDRFSEIYDSMYDDLFRYLARRVRRVEDADDLLADVFTVVWQKLNAVPGQPGTRPWVFAVARNHVRNHSRQGLRHDQLHHRRTGAPEGFWALLIG